MSLMTLSPLGSDFFACRIRLPLHSFCMVHFLGFTEPHTLVDEPCLVGLVNLGPRMIGTFEIKCALVTLVLRSGHRS